MVAGNILPSQESKHCPKCGENKPLSAFYKNSAKPDGFWYCCKVCYDNLRRVRMQRYKANGPARKSEKLCFACQQVKPIEDFYKDCHKLDGYHNICKVCAYARVRTIEQEIKADPQKAARRRSVKKAYNDKYGIRCYYGISREEYNLLLEIQGGVCAICNQPETARSEYTDRPKRLGVDHNHKTGQARGLLCTRCNSAIGFFNEDTERIKQALAYLDHHSSSRPLEVSK